MIDLNTSPRSLNFVQALKFTLPWETGTINGNLRPDGGLHYKDGGQPTKYGIWQGANPDLDVANLTLDQAIEVYKVRYWLIYITEKPVYIALDQAEIGLAVSVFDAGVNCGVRRAWEWFLATQNSEDQADAINIRRRLFYAGKKDNTNYNGWMNRVNDLKKYVDIIRTP